MTGFDVSTGALDAFAAIVGDPNAGSASLEYKYLFDAGKYADEWVKLEGGGGGLVLSALVGKTEEVHQQISADNYSISTALIESAEGLTASSAAYHATDHAAASKLDQTYKPAGVDVPASAPDTRTAAADPSARLVEPSEEGAVPEMVESILHATDWYSISGLALKILGWCGYHPEEWLNEKLFGDFGAVAKVKNALENLAAFDTQAAADLNDGLATMLGSWSGNAASACEAYFEKLAGAIGQRSNALRETSTKYGDVLVAIQQAGEALADGLNNLLDTVVEAAVSIAAAGCLQEVPGVDVVIDIIGAAKVFEIYRKIDEMTTIWVRVWAGAEGILALITALAGILPGYDVASSIPSMGYYNASQGPAPSYNEAPSAPRRGQMVAQ